MNTRPLLLLSLITAAFQLPAATELPIRVELYEGTAETALEPGGRSGIILSEKREGDSILLKLRNASSQQRSLGVRICAELKLKGPVNYWDGYEAHEALTGRKERKELADTFPMSCVWAAERGIALGIDPENLFSFLRSTADHERITYETRLVLNPATESPELRFVVYSFEPRWGWKSALDQFYLKFPASFHASPRIDPRVVSGTEGSNFAYDGWRYRSYPELFRRLRVGNGWCYAPWKRSGDFYVRPETWDWEIAPELKPNLMKWIGNAPSPEVFHATRKKNFENGKPANCSNLFYISNCCESQLAQSKYASSIILPLQTMVWNECEISPRMFPAGGAFGKQWNQDMIDLGQELNIGGFAWDSTGGMGYRPYRGEQMWEMPVVAFDEEGPLVSEGVGIALAIRHMHQSVPVFEGRYNAACKVNPGGEHPMAYTMNMAADSGMIEWKMLLPYGRDIKLVNKYRRLMGQKLIEHHSAIRNDRLGSLIEWRDYPPEQIELTYRVWWEYQILAYLYYGVTPFSDFAIGVPQAFPILDMILDLNRRGWYSSPSASAPDKLLVSRYGQGLRSVVCLGNPEITPIDGTVTLHGRDFGGDTPLVASYDGKPLTFESAAGESKLPLNLAQRRWVALELIGSWSGEAKLKSANSITKTRHELTARIENKGDTVQGTWKFPLIENCSAPVITANGQPLAGKVVGQNFVVNGELPKGAELQASYPSTTCLSPDQEIAGWEYTKDNHPNCAIILLNNPSERSQQAASWIQHYFDFWHKESGTLREGLKLPILPAGQPVTQSNQIVLETGKPRSIQLTGNTLRITAPDDWDLGQWVWESLSILDSRYPFVGVFGAAYNTWCPDPPFGKDEKTKQMLKETGLWGKTLALYQGPELADIRSYTAAELKKIYGVQDPAPAGTVQAGPATGTNETFDSMNGLEIRKGFRCVNANGEIDLQDMKEGSGALKTTWDSDQDQYGEIRITRNMKEADLTGAKCELWIKPLTDQAYSWGVELWDADNKMIEDQRVWTIKKGEWYPIRFTVGTAMPKGLGTYYKKGEGNPARANRIVFRSVVKKMGEPQVALWDNFTVSR